MNRKAKHLLAMYLALASVPLLTTGDLAAQALGSGFTYQGQLKDAGQPASGLYDLQLCLFDTQVNPIPLACAPDFNDIPVEDGLFAITLDFGTAHFVGQQRYLELRVRPGASGGGYTILAPRQLIRPAPEALRANVSAAAPWSGLTGVPAGFADGVDNDSGGTVTSVAAGTGLSGGTITGSGTLGIANNGVGSAQIADGSVAAVDVAPDSLGAAQLANNAVAAAELADNAVDTNAVQNLAITQGKIAIGAVGQGQINPAQVQIRITGTCPVGEYFRGINTDGSVACEPVPGVPRITTVDDPMNDVGSYTSIAIGLDGLPVISYRDNTAAALRVAKCANAACTGAATISTVDDPTNQVGSFNSIAIGGDPRPVISYYDNTAGALKVAKCSNEACTSSVKTTVDDPSNNVGTWTSIAVAADGRPVISYHDVTAGALKVAKCADAGCSAATTIIVDDSGANIVGLYTDIAIGADGLPVISYRDNTAGTLKVAKCLTSDCTGVTTITTVDDPPANVVGQYTSIAIGSDTLPVISYYDNTAAALKVAKCANHACSGTATITTVDDSANVVGVYTSIAIGTDGLPVISYHDSTAGTLKVARCANAACTGAATITIVDNPATSVGLFNAIAIGDDGLPVISYYDSDADALRVTKCGTRSCQ